MPTSRLGALQVAFLDEFFQRESRFFLTGGAALAGFHLGHRTTEDLDLFTPEDIAVEGAAVAAEIARALGATIESLRTSPSFRRLLVRRGTESVVVDLVHDPTPQLHAQKPLLGRIRVDPPDEILANKLCALLSRAEIRDLVDVRALEGIGLSVEAVLSAASAKDAGLTAAQLAWVLSQIRIGDDASPPGGVRADELRTYLADLVARLSRSGFPGRGM